MYKGCGEDQMLNQSLSTDAGVVQDKSGLTLSLCKAFDILNCFTPETPTLRITDITKRVGMTQSNVSRLVNTMVVYGFIEKNDESGYYQLGKRIITLSSVALNHSEIRCQALPELYRLEQEFKVGANLAVLANDEMYYLAHVDSRTSPRMYTMVGYTSPLHCTAIGKILLASMQEAEIARILKEKGMRSYTPQTITSYEAMMEQIERIRKKGYSVEYGERSFGSSCIAAGIRGRSGKIIAGISVSGKFCDLNMSDHEEEVAHIVMESAAIISNKLGHLV